MACPPDDDALPPPQLTQEAEQTHSLMSVVPAQAIAGEGASPARATLPPPSPEALARAAPLFARLMGLHPKAAQASGPTAEPISQAGPPTPMRAYPLAHALLPTVPDAQGTPRGRASPGPQGFVRGSVPAPKPVDAVPQLLLEELAQAAQVGQTHAALGQVFDIVFREELLGALRCRLHVAHDQQVTATFRAADAHTARLLRAETGRLRLQFEARGLAHVIIAVEDDSQAGGG